ncbi:MAG TPA: hypothetical protein EYP04_11415 [Anaerolineae bacterium]|nr:hypothetical protein [Anaerolineae bacterium]HIQ05568.1 hypothetical protein [Anaerolineae bacterium]
MISVIQLLGTVSHNFFGGFAEHLGHCICGGIFDEGSPLSDELSLRCDVLNALKRLQMPVVRYPGGNFVSGYRWCDGVGPRDNIRPAWTWPGTPWNSTVSVRTSSSSSAVGWVPSRI